MSPSLLVSPSPVRVPSGLWCYRVDRRRALLGGATSEGGNVYAWMQETLRLNPDAGRGGANDAIERALADLPPDGHGLTVLPFLAGERSPGWAGDVRATIHGLGLSTTPVEILRAGLEAVAYRFALIADALFGDERSSIDSKEDQETRRPGDQETTASRAYIPPSPPLPLSLSRQSSKAVFVASGGGLLGSPTWVQIMADVLGRPIVTSAESEATSRGVALLALAALGAVGSIEDLPAADGPVYEPDTASHAIYQAAIERQRKLYTLFYSSV